MALSLKTIIDYFIIWLKRLVAFYLRCKMEVLSKLSFHPWNPYHITVPAPLFRGPPTRTADLPLPDAPRQPRREGERASDKSLWCPCTLYNNQYITILWLYHDLLEQTSSVCMTQTCSPRRGVHCLMRAGLPIDQYRFKLLAWHCITFLGKTAHSQCLSPPRCINESTINYHPIQEVAEILLVFSCC